MPMHDTYMLHLYRSRAVGGWQWSARVDHLVGGETRRFTDPEALLAYLRTLVWTGEPSVQATNTASRAATPGAPVEDHGTSRTD
jgi:hypothetical protein